MICIIVEVQVQKKARLSEQRSVFRSERLMAVYHSEIDRLLSGYVLEIPT